jgi:hypothetical protein
MKTREEVAEEINVSLTSVTAGVSGSFTPRSFYFREKVPTEPTGYEAGWAAKRNNNIHHRRINVFTLVKGATERAELNAMDQVRVFLFLHLLSSSDLE